MKQRFDMTRKASALLDRGIWAAFGECREHRESLDSGRVTDLIRKAFERAADEIVLECDARGEEITRLRKEVKRLKKLEEAITLLTEKKEEPCKESPPKPAPLEAALAKVKEFLAE